MPGITLQQLKNAQKDESLSDSAGMEAVQGITASFERATLPWSKLVESNNAWMSKNTEILQSFTVITLPKLKYGFIQEHL